MPQPNAHHRETSFGPTRLSFALLIHAYVALIRMDLHLACRGFASLYRTVKQVRVRPGTGNVERTCYAIDLACVFYFKQVLCLQRSAATAALLRRYGIPAEMVIGVQQCPFRAHAWVEVAGAIVNDKPYTSELYTVMDRC